MPFHASMNARTLHKVWQELPEADRLGFLGALSQDAADRLLAFQLQKREAAEREQERAKQRVRVRPSKAQVSEMIAAAPAYPQGEPNDHWTNEQLAAYITHQDALAALAAAQAPPSDEGPAYYRI